jgi:hypothetical protein
MIADCPGCAADGAEVREQRRARARLPWLGLLPAILYALAPKCPMCLVAYLSAFGVTFGMASFALSVLRPLAVVFAVLALGFALWRAKVPSFRDRAQGDMEAAAEPKRGCGMHTEQLRIPHDSR